MTHRHAHTRVYIAITVFQLSTARRRACHEEVIVNACRLSSACEISVIRGDNNRVRYRTASPTDCFTSRIANHDSARCARTSRISFYSASASTRTQRGYLTTTCSSGRSAVHVCDRRSYF